MGEEVEEETRNSTRPDPPALGKRRWNPFDLSKREVALWKACGLGAEERQMVESLLSCNKRTHLLYPAKGGSKDCLKLLQHLP